MALTIPEMPDPSRSGVNAGLQGLSATFQQLAQQSLQREQMAAQNLMRQKELEIEQRRMSAEEARQQAESRRADQADKRLMGEQHLRIAELWQKDPHLAASYVNALGGKARAEPVYGEPPKSTPLTDDEAIYADTLPQAQADPLEGLMSRATSGGPTASSNPVDAALAGFDGGAPTSEPAPNPLVRAARGQAARDGAVRSDADAAAQAGRQRTTSEGVNPLVAIAQGRPLLGHRLRYSLGDGPETVLDPVERKQILDSSSEQERQEAASRALAAADEIEKINPGMAGMAQKTRALAGYVRAGLVKPDQVASHIEKLLGMDTQMAIAQGHDATRVATAGKRGSGGFGGTGGGFNLKTEKQNETELTHIGSETEKFRKASGLDKAVPAYQDLAKAEYELAHASNPQTQIGVVDRLVRANTGGKATIGQIRIQLEHMGGLDAQLEGWLEGKGTGQLGAKQLATLKAAISAAKESTKAEIGNAHQAFVNQHFSGADYGQKGNWENAHEGLFGTVVDEKGQPIFATQHDPNAPTIVRGSGQRSSRTVGVNARAGAGPQGTASAQLSPADEQLAAQARQQVAQNGPLAASARKWLAANGLTP